MEKRVLQLASVASMIDLFNTDNINILRSLGFSVDVATNFEEGSITSQDRVNEYREELKEQNSNVYHIPIPRSIIKIGKIVKSYKMVKHLVEKEQYEFVHCHSPIGGVVCRMACRKARKNGTKVIYTAHGFHFFKGASKVAWAIYYPVEKWCSRYTDVLITINQEDYQNALKMNAGRVEYVPGIGIHVEEIKETGVNRKSMRAEFGFRDEDFIFMSTGQISIRKNQELIIRALAKISNEKVKYLIVGFGEEQDRLGTLAKKLGVENRVCFAGYRRDVKEILHAVDAFVFPSLQEGLPVALMEAMAAGLPVVCSKIRGNIDLIETNKGGYLYDCHDIDGFAEGMRKISTRNNSDMVQVNQQTIREYDIDCVRKKMTDIYLSI